MEVYTYSKARQHLAEILDQAREEIVAAVRECRTTTRVEPLAPSKTSAAPVTGAGLSPLPGRYRVLMQHGV